MALSRTEKGVWISDEGFGLGAFTTGAFTPPNNSLLVVGVGIQTGGEVVDPSDDLTISDSTGLSWTRRGYAGNATWEASGIAVFTAPVTTGTSMTISVDCGGVEANVYIVEVIAFTGHNGASPIGAIISDAAMATDGSDSMTLSSSPAATSIVIAFLGKGLNGTSGTATSTHGTGWSEIYDTGLSTCQYLQSQDRGNSTSSTVLWDDIFDGAGGPISCAYAVAIEIKILPTAAVTGTATASITEADIV